VKKVAREDTVEFQNADSCQVIEYPFGEKDINGSVISVNGRYPESGYAVNEVCKEVVYITKGSGKLVLEDGSMTDFEAGDSLFVDANEKYFWEGKFESYMACSPAFYPEQHKVLN
jgi:mannose-6-phosphate isomerase-like protein (cupin superfamily)